MTDTFIYPNHGPYTALAQSIKGGPLVVRKVMGGGGGSFCRNFFHPIIIFFNHMTLHEFFYYPTPPLTTFLMVRQARHARSLRFSVRILIKFFLLFFFYSLFPSSRSVYSIRSLCSLFHFFSNQSSFFFFKFHLFYIYFFGPVQYINPIRPWGEGGGWAESVRADLDLRELPCYLSNTNEILPVLLKFIGEQDIIKMFCKGYNLLPWQPDF